MSVFLALALIQTAGSRIAEYGTFIDWVKIAGALIAFFIGLSQYRKAQRWKRREFIAAQIKEFESDSKIQAVFTMLDWKDRYVQLPSNKTGKDEPVIVTDPILARALLPHSPRSLFHDYEASIRDCFDRFFDALDRLQVFVDSKLISKEELFPYIEYWIQRIVDDNRQHPPEIYSLLRNYIQRYGFSGAKRLIESYGHTGCFPVNKRELSLAIEYADPHENTNGTPSQGDKPTDPIA
jgi:hypothetical protein